MTDSTPEQFDEEARLFLEANPDIETVELIFPDMNGVARGKSLPAGSLAKLSGGKVRLPRSTYALDIWGEDVDATGLAIAMGDPDGIGLPVPGTLKRTPWRRRPTAQVLMSMVEIDGTTPVPYDPRHVLSGLMAKFAGRGLTPVVATELEFYFVDPDRAPGERPLPPLHPDGTGRLEGSQIYDIDVAGLFEDVLQEIRDACDLQGIPADSTISEFGPGQFEINLLHVDDALHAADQSYLFRHAVRNIARRHGLEATFMAKPYEDRPGNGLHVHASMLDAEGKNIFSGDGSGVCAALRHAVGGLLATMEDGLAIFAPHANSYRRLRREYYAPVSPTWGIDHRAVAVRVPAFSGPDARFEHRVAGADANPWLALTAILAGALHGMDGEIDPGAPIDAGNPDTSENVSPEWAPSLRRFAESGFIPDAFGEEYARVYLACRTAEYTRFACHVSDFDYATYLGRL